MTPPHVRSVNVGAPETGPWTGRVGRTGIRKKPQPGPVTVRRLGLAGDSVCDEKFHGGPDQAVYAFAREDLDRWGRALGAPLPDGHFGENLTTVGIDVNDALVGERWRVGAVLLEVSGVRIPCRVFAGFMGVTGYDDTGWIKRFTADGRPGPYLRVLEEGSVAPGDPVVVEQRPRHGVRVTTMFRALTTEPHLMPRLLEVEDLADRVRARVERHLARSTPGFPTSG